MGWKEDWKALPHAELVKVEHNAHALATVDFPRKSSFSSEQLDVYRERLMTNYGVGKIAAPAPVEVKNEIKQEEKPKSEKTGCRPLGRPRKK